jgi:hypothetical protein
MLSAGQTQTVKFKVNVMGTSAEPRVRLILGTSPELSFAASKEQEHWVSSMQIPKHVEAGSYDMRVEVHLNNRLFTPINKKIEIKGFEGPAEVVTPAAMPEVEAAVEAAVESKKTEQKPVEASPEIQEPTEPTDLPEPTLAAPEAHTDIVRDGAQTRRLMLDITAADELPQKPKVVQLPKSITPPKAVKAKPVLQPVEQPKIEVPAAPPMSLLSTIAKTPAKLKLESKKPKAKVSVTATPIQIKISEIDASTTAEVSHLAELSPAKPLKTKKTELVKLVKEELIYE